MAIKVVYNLWDKYPPDEEEQYLIDLLKSKWEIDLDIYNPAHIEFLILVLGRRSTKSTTMSYIATYEIYDLICKGNPQKYYGIRERHPIHIMHVAAAGDQAQDVFGLSYDNIRKIPFFRKYIDFDKDSATKLRLFTPFDLILNEKVRQRNKSVIRGGGVQKESTLPGSLFIESITTSAASSRGKAVKTLMLSEYAHFERSKRSGGVDDGVMSSNPRTDYEIWKALVPAVKDFNKGHLRDGRVICESSPKEKGGEFYNRYSIAGGMEKEGGASPCPTGYKLIQLSTWEARPGFVESDFDSEFLADPVGASAEYGAHFINPSGSFIDEAVIERVPNYDRKMVYINEGVWKFVVSIDPGGKAKKKKADTYAVTWGHIEKETMGERFCEYWIDGLEAFDSKIIPIGGGKFTQESVDPNVVTDFIVNLTESLGGRNYIMEIVYDQFDSGAPIATLQGLGLPAIETFFTNKYKSAMFGDYLSKMNNHQLHFAADGDPKGLVDRWKQENKYLQRITRGEYTFYGHPTSGPVQNDDTVMCTANMIHRLAMRIAPTKQSIKENRKHGTGPIQRRVTVKPITVSHLGSGNRGGGTGNYR